MIVNIICVGKLKNFIDYQSLAIAAMKRGCKLRVVSADRQAPFGVGEQYLGPATLARLAAIGISRDALTVVHGNGIGIIVTIGLKTLGCKVFLDVRSPPVKSGLRAFVAMRMLQWYVERFSETTLMQDHFVLKSVLGVQEAKIKLRPIFAPMAYSQSGNHGQRPKRTGAIKLVYAGSLRGRRVHEWINTLKKHNNNKIFLDVFAESGRDLDLLAKAAKAKGIAFQHQGIVSRSQLEKQLRGYCLGLSFIPRMTVYEPQVPTKIFDYLSAGIPCISNWTATIEHHFGNRKEVIIRDDLGGIDFGLLDRVRQIQVDRALNFPTFEEVWENALAAMIASPERKP